MATIYYPVYKLEMVNGKQSRKLAAIAEGQQREPDMQALEASQIIAPQFDRTHAVGKVGGRHSSIASPDEIAGAWRAAVKAGEDAADFRERFALDSIANYSRWETVAKLKLGKAFQSLPGSEASDMGGFAVGSADADNGEAPTAEAPTAEAPATEAPETETEAPTEAPQAPVKAKAR